MDERDYQFMNNELNQNNMEQSFKLDLTQLTPVEEADRIKGNWYLVADSSDGAIIITPYHSGSSEMANNGERGIRWNCWFAIPPNLPGFPVDELPTMPELGKVYEFDTHSSNDLRGYLVGFEFELMGGTIVKTDNIRSIKSDLPDLIKLPLNEWSYSYSDTHIVLHKTKRMQPITIPSGTKAEQIEAVRKLLNQLQTNE